MRQWILALSVLLLTACTATQEENKNKNAQNTQGDVEVRLIVNSVDADCDNCALSVKAEGSTLEHSIHPSGADYSIETITHANAMITIHPGVMTDNGFELETSSKTTAVFLNSQLPQDISGTQSSVVLCMDYSFTDSTIVDMYEGYKTDTGCEALSNESDMAMRM
ncbi:hypothetical protein N9R79_02835 [Vibrio sp.]|nr:hypothetical protein [Vibrio sp.]